MLKILFLPLICIILILNLQSIATIFAEGAVSCTAGPTGVTTGIPQCGNSVTNSCSSGFIPPSCQAYATQTKTCPMSLDCIPSGTTPTPGPTATPGVTCGDQGQKCCGVIPPLRCNGFIPSDPNVPASCFCNVPAPTSTPTITPPGATSVPVSPPPGGAGEPCDFNGKDGIKTAIGCVPTEPTEFITAVSQLATGAGGGIALLLMIAGVFRMMTSAGNPDAVKAGSEQLTSALIGLLFIIFAVLLLKVIGMDILNIPGFNK